jgi:hypothetical protein
MKPKFEVGDVVVATRDMAVLDYYKKGDIGTVKMIRKRMNSTFYLIPEFGDHTLREPSIEHLTMSDTEIARKLYKDKIRRIENGRIYFCKKP